MLLLVRLNVNDDRIGRQRCGNGGNGAAARYTVDDWHVSNGHQRVRQPFPALLQRPLPIGSLLLPLENPSQHWGVPRAALRSTSFGLDYSAAATARQRAAKIFTGRRCWPLCWMAVTSLPFSISLPVSSIYRSEVDRLILVSDFEALIRSWFISSVEFYWMEVEVKIFWLVRSNNFFHGIWRIPINEIDRPGCFAAHMGRSTALLLEVLHESRDHRLLMELALALKPEPEADKKYLFDSEREQHASVALSLMGKVLRIRLQAIKEALESTPPPKEGDPVPPTSVQQVRSITITTITYLVRLFFSKNHIVVYLLNEYIRIMIYELIINYYMCS